MLVGVVSDTHNNLINIENIINIFNKEEVNIVIHTGDISKPETLRLFTRLNCPMMGVFGNNDRIEQGFKEVCDECNFNFQDPPFPLTLEDKKIAVFHEPELIDKFIKELANHEIENLKTIEPDLEDIFLSYYGEQKG